MTAPIDGGAPQSISNLPIDDSQFDVSPDGKLAAFGTVQHSGEHKERLAIVDISTGQAKLTDFERPRFGLIRFNPDGKGVVYAARQNGVDNLWLQPLDGSKGRQITDFTSERIYDFHWSFDGKQLEFVIRRQLTPAAEAEENMVSSFVSKDVGPLCQDAFFVSSSLIMQKLRAQAALMAKTDVPVLILGERGSGKFTVASLIHSLSVRSGFRLHRINCAQMPESVLES